MSPARPTRWGVAGCSSRLLEPLGAALRDSELASGIAVLAAPAAWDDPRAPERLARLLGIEPIEAVDFSAAGAEATYLTPAAASCGVAAGADLLHALASARSALLVEPPVPASAERLAGRGSAPLLLATAHLLRWHPVAVIASDAVEAREVGEVLSAEIQVGISPGLPSVLGTIDVLGLVLGGDDVATLQPIDPEPGSDPGPARWHGRTRGGIPVHVAAPAPEMPQGACSITVTGSKGRLTAIMEYPGGDPNRGPGRLQFEGEGRDEIIPVPDADPVRVLVDRFSRAALGAAPWGWSFARDLRLQALARDAVTRSPESDGAPT